MSHLRLNKIFISLALFSLVACSNKGFMENSAAAKKKATLNLGSGITGSQTGALSDSAPTPPPPIIDNTDPNLIDGNQYSHCEDLNLLKKWTSKDGSSFEVRNQEGVLYSLEVLGDERTLSILDWDAGDCSFSKKVIRKVKANETLPFNSDPKSYKITKLGSTLSTGEPNSITITPCLGSLCTQLLKNEALDLTESIK